MSCILLLGTVNSISCAPCVNAQVNLSQINYNNLNCVENSWSPWLDNKCSKIEPIVNEAEQLMTKNTGLVPTFNSSIEIREDGDPLLINYGGGAYIPKLNSILLTKERAKDKNFIAHEMTHAELCNRLNTCKGIFPYKHSIGFEEGITSQNNLGLYDRNSQDIIKTQHTLCNQAANKENCYEKMDQLLDRVYKEDFKRKLIFAPVTKGGGASYLVHQELISKWIEEKGLNVIEDMINAVNEKNIFPEEYFLQNGGEKIILNRYGEEGLKNAKINLKLLKMRYYGKYAIVPLFALLTDRTIREYANFFKLVKLGISKLKSNLAKKDNNIKEIETNPCNEDINQEEITLDNVSAEETTKTQEENDENSLENLDKRNETVLSAPIENNVSQNIKETNKCNSAEIFSNANNSILENEINSIVENKDNAKQLIKNMLKYRLQTVSILAVTKLLFAFCSQQI